MEPQEQNAIQFSLYRLTLPSTTTSLFEGDRREVLRRIFDQAAPLSDSYGSLWKIGTVRSLEGEGLYFRFGKIRNKENPSFQGGDFVDTEFVNAPYTIIVLDLRTSVFAIANDIELARPLTVANKLVDILSSADPLSEANLDMGVESVDDPTDFVEFLRSSTEIQRITLAVLRPNPDDEDEYIEPIADLVQHSGATHGNLSLTGGDIIRDEAVKMARSAIAKGAQMRATARTAARSRWQTRTLKKGPVNFSMDEDSRGEEVLEALREAYERARYEEES